VPTAASASTAGDAAGRYIVVLRGPEGEPAAAAAALTGPWGGTVHHVYHTAVRGFAASLSPAAAAALAADPRVALVEPDQRMHATGTVQPSPTWGLDRVDQRALPLDASYGYEFTGAGTHSYIFDTGIRYTHAEFTAGDRGRAFFAYDAVGDGENGWDCNGHGTHVAGTVGGATYGVAKETTLWAVRVLDCTGGGYVSGLIAAVDWVTANHRKPAVANLSLAGPPVATLEAAIRRSIEAGVTYVVAAGNANQDACGTSPARVAEVITVGATDAWDRRAYYSNWGACVDWFAPGSDISSAWWNDDDAVQTISGTSMAAPHVAGVAAQFLQANPRATPAAVRRRLFDATTRNVVQFANSPNPHLLYSRFDSLPGNLSPAAAFTAQCSGLECQLTDGSSDADGALVRWSWDFGDGTGSTQRSPSHTFAASGNYLVSLTVHDDEGATATIQQTVSAHVPIMLTVRQTRVFELARNELSWAGATSAEVEIRRNGAVVATVPNVGTYSDPVVGSGTTTYQVCEAGSQVCSNRATS
jgi:subtilisin family serine protease